MPQEGFDRLATLIAQRTTPSDTQPVSGTVTANAGTGTFTVSGTVTDGGSGKTLKRAIFSSSSDGDIVAAVANKVIKVYAYAIQSSADSMTAQITSNNAAGTTLTLAWSLNAREGVMGSAVNPPAYLFKTAQGEALYMNLTGTGTITVEVSYWDDDAS